MKLTLDRSMLGIPGEGMRREWLETNGLGGWAGSTVTGAHTRRYHGLLVAATHPPVGRMVMLSKLDETIVVGGERHELGTNAYPGTLHPHGYRSLTSFEKDLFPRFGYEAGGVRLTRTVIAPDGENTTLLLYDVLDAPSAFELEFRPLMSPRDYHSLSRANDAIRRDAEFRNGILRVRAYDGVPDLYIGIPDSTFTADPSWYYNFEYVIEQYRGLDYAEDLFSHGVLRKTVRKGDRFGVIISLDSPEGRDALALARIEEERRRRLFGTLPVRDDLSETLALAADQFIVRRGDRGRTIIAGYHWFSDWGRDTMIALPGLCLATGRFGDAKEILRSFAAHVSQGMLPNRFPDAGETPEYNTVDATLWFFVAIDAYLRYSGDAEFVRDELVPVLLDIIAWHDRGTRYGIHTDSDGLLCAGEPGVQLTWMDAKIGDWVVTPRQGKTVEINALWYNALKILADLLERSGLDGAEALHRRAEAVKARFGEVFWNEAGGSLFDTVDGGHRDDAVRPNQLFAVSLPYPLLEGDRALSVLDTVRRQLLTPVGLRSLSPDDPAYRPVYGGDPLLRDSAYHQGTVWSWLIGPYITAAVRTGAAEDEDLLAGLKEHLLDAGIGSVSEIFDGDPPWSPRGCIAQAWGVAEMLRAYVEDIRGVTPRVRRSPNKRNAQVPSVAQ